MGRLLLRAISMAALALAVGGLLPAVVAAHPLGNFTINHYAALTVAPALIDLDVVIDMAEIPAFQERQEMDGDGDGLVDDGEAARGAADRCPALAPNLRLEADGAALSLTVTRSAISFPPGAGGLSTLRLECGFSATMARPIDGSTVITFSDGSYAQRIGWREILASGNGTELETGGLPTISPSSRLTSYPTDLLLKPLDMRSARIVARSVPGGASPSTGPGGASGGSGGASGGSGAPTPAANSPAGAVPGGVGGEIPDIFRSADLTPLVALISLLTAAGLGAWHAVTPGHGKTIMAAYLVGTRGTAIHAVGLGLSVTVSHTLGILGLALLVVGAQGILPPDVVVRAAPLVAAVSIVTIGAWMLAVELRRRLAVRRVTAQAQAQARDHEAGRDHDHDPADEHPHEHPREHPHGHQYPHVHEQPREQLDPLDPLDPLEHSHGGVRHSHLPAAGGGLSWRGLFALGLAGGLIPSTSALLILLLSVEVGRPAFGIALVLAFGLGMAAVMTGIGVILVLARTRLNRMPSSSGLGRVAAVAPLVAAIVVFSLGVYLTVQAVVGTIVL